MSELLRVRGLSASYETVRAVDNVDLEVAAGECVALLGGPGSGKTTVLSAIAGLIPSTGTIDLRGQDLASLDAVDRVAAGIATVPEGRRLFPSITIAETLSAASAPRHRRKRWTPRTVYELFPFLWSARRNPATALGVGEQQAVAIGRALVSAPDLLLIDEPSLGLAPAMADQITSALRRVLDGGLAAIVVDHDYHRALGLADRVYGMAGSTIVFEGTVAEFNASLATQHETGGTDR